MAEEDFVSKLTGDKRLSLAHRELHELPLPIVNKFGSVARELDLTGNNLTDLGSLRGFTTLQVLILDGNRITSHTAIPPLLQLHTLWVNKNKIDNLSLFIDKVVQSCPNVKFLSMLMNDACPNYFNGGTPSQYQDYRYYVINRLRNLTHLDDLKVSDEEKRQAIKKYGSLETIVARDEKEKKELEEKRRQLAEAKKKQLEAEAKKLAREEKERRRARRRAQQQQLLQQQNGGVPISPPLPPGVLPKETPPPPPPAPPIATQGGLMGELARRLGGIDLPDVDRASSSSSTVIASPVKLKEDDSYKWSSSDDEAGLEEDWTDEDEDGAEDFKFPQ